VAIDLLKDQGVPLDRQEFDWRGLVQRPYSKLDDDAFTRVRVILMNGLEMGALRLQHMAARFNRDLREPLARLRRVEHFQQTTVNWLNPPDQSPLETTLGYEQAAIEITASVAQHEPDPYLAQVYRFGMLEDFDHLYRYGALYDRVEGKDPNNLTQSYTDIRPGRPTAVEHRHPLDDLRRPYAPGAHPLSKIHAALITDAEHQTHDFYMNVGPMYPDPVARQLYAEIAAIEEQHVTQYESLLNPEETWLEKLLLHEAMEVYAYSSCLAYESNPRIKALWERFLEYELGHLGFMKELFERTEKRDAASVLPATLPEPIRFAEHREYVRKVLNEEVDLRADGTEFVDRAKEPKRSLEWRARLNKEGSPTEPVAAGYRWQPGTVGAGRAQQYAGLLERSVQ
jgi:rubrerythrin